MAVPLRVVRVVSPGRGELSCGRDYDMPARQRSDAVPSSGASVKLWSGGGRGAAWRLSVAYLPHASAAYHAFAPRPLYKQLSPPPGIVVNTPHTLLPLFKMASIPGKRPHRTHCIYPS